MDSGTSLMELHWKTVINVLPINIVYFGELNFAVTVVLGQMVSIGVRFKLKTMVQERQFMWDYIITSGKNHFHEMNGDVGMAGWK